MSSGPSQETPPRKITCEACGWEVVVEGGRYIQGISPEWGARARRSGHIAATGCPVDAVAINIVDGKSRKDAVTATKFTGDKG